MSSNKSLINSAKKLSGLSEDEIVERALKLWLEVHRLDSDGWKAVFHKDGISFPVSDWELTKDDTNKVERILFQLSSC